MDIKEEVTYSLNCDKCGGVFKSKEAFNLHICKSYSIREGIADILDGATELFKDGEGIEAMDFDNDKATNQIITYLKENGMAQVVEGFGLPDTPSKRDGYAVYWRCYQLAQQDMLKAGYRKVEADPTKWKEKELVV